MSNFNCEQCGTAIIDSPTGYVTECEHFPLDTKQVAQGEIGELRIEPLQFREMKHDPHCECGICGYCNGVEDVYGRSTLPAQGEIDAVEKLRKYISNLRGKVLGWRIEEKAYDAYEILDAGEWQIDDLKTIARQSAELAAVTAERDGLLAEANETMVKICAVDGIYGKQLAMAFLEKHHPAIKAEAKK